jgi:hypothetical protein
MLLLASSDSRFEIVWFASLDLMKDYDFGISFLNLKNKQKW